MLPYVISSTLRRRLLTHYFTHADEKYYVREIARILDLDPGNLSKEFHKLAEDGLFLEDRKGRIKFYRLNPQYPLYDELKQIIFKTEGIEGSLRKLIARFSKIKLAFIYGSYAIGKENALSDVDLLIVGTPDLRKLSNQVRDLEKKLKREINFSVYSESEFQEKSAQKGSFLAEITEGPKIILKGKI